MKNQTHRAMCAATLFLIWSMATTLSAEVLSLTKGDSIAIIGNTLADRMQHHGWLETYIQAAHPNHELTIRNLGFAGDEVKTRPRSQSFGSPDEWLTKVEANVVFCFFGYNEALRGAAGLAQFEMDLGEMIDGMQGNQYDGKSAPRIVVFSPIAHENLNSHVLPDGSENNEKLALYTAKMKNVCESKSVRFVDLFTVTKQFYEASKEPLTMNGIHLLEHGNKVLARSIVKTLFNADAPTDSDVTDLREAVLDKSYHWFSRYRVVDGYNVYGGRSALNWHGQSNKDVMIREMEIFDVMTANRDKRIWAVAKGNTNYKVVDDNLPAEVAVKTNKRGDKDDGSYTYLGGKEAIEKMKMASGMKVNLFASEEMFPQLVNPVQMAVDTDSRLFVSVWPSYPHWNPTEPRTDRIICLPDENRDGVADKCVVFADELNSITGFEFWGGGMLVCAPPEIWFLKDTDGDDKADVKIRMLQGVSSADTHHTANAMVIGPDGGLYWSRGVFHVTNMETPTKTFRSTTSGVYRFDPRTYEIDFHFPIGPNPHGDFFDQWGYQFVNDGTGGTGSYVNIGKGVGNKQWFKKRVRPVAATGMLSSSHFPEANQGNFLICNTIGFLGVLQHEVKYNGADIYAEEIEPILVSSDQNFRPTDLEVGGDGALYVSDWSNALIGHMQHNMRDPNRDHAHGRIYRVTYEGRDLLKPWKLKGRPIFEVLKAFYAKENGVRYRARLELSGRATDDVTRAVAEFAAKLDPSDPADAQALLESLWVFEEHRIPNHDLVKRIMAGVAEPRVRAAAIRTLGHWGMKVADWQSTLKAAAQDESPLVRAEAVKAAVSFDGLEAAEVIFEVANQETDPELDTVINFARSRINVDAVVQDAVKSGKTISVAAQKYVLRNASVEDLLKLNRSKAVYEAILERPNATVGNIQEAIAGLASEANKDPVAVLMHTIFAFDGEQRDANYEAFGQAVAALDEESLATLGDDLVRMSTTAKADELRQAGFAGWITATKSAQEPFIVASKSKESLRDLLRAVSLIASPELRGSMFDNVRFLTSSLPEHLAREAGSSAIAEAGIKVDYFGQNPGSVEREKLAKLKPAASGIVPGITIDVPQLGRRDEFALRFSGAITIEKSGRYEFHIASDDGSRLYIGNKELINHDGLHGMSEKSNRIRLTAGMHPFELTYFDNGGGDGLRVLWSGPGFKRQPIPTDQLSVVGAETIHDVAIATLNLIPGYEVEKFQTLATLIIADQHRTSAVRALLDVDGDSWPEAQVALLAETLATYVSKIPARYRTGKTALEAMRLTDMLAARLPDDQKRAYQSQLADLAVNVIRIGTVPHRMIYDKERLAIQAGKPVEFIFTNTDSMPHNFAIVKPGALEEVGLAAEATARDAGAMARHYIPKSDKILLASRLIQPTETQALSFEAPTQPGIYPYVCTYPGHWRRMYGALYVVADLKAYLADPDKYVAANPLPLRDELLKYNERNTEWALDDLAPSLMTLVGQGHEHHAAPRDFEVGRSVFKAASCVACHQLNGEGYVFGPDLAKLDPQKSNPKHILESLLEPSKVIDENYRSYTFQMESGLTVTGLILKETADEVHVIVDPIAKPEPTVLKKDEIEDRVKSDVSTMPKGLANKLTREEILDLIAYVHSGGKMKHKVFAGGHDHHDH